MTKVRDAISDVLDRMTIADMAAIIEGGNVTPITAGSRALASELARKKAGLA
jgi:DNA-binding IscR family transcriptional regulator